MAPKVLDEIEPRELYSLCEFYHSDRMNTVKENNELFAIAVKVGVINALKNKKYTIFDEKNKTKNEKRHVEKKDKLSTLSYLKEIFK